MYALADAGSLYTSLGAFVSRKKLEQKDRQTANPPKKTSGSRNSLDSRTLSATVYTREPLAVRPAQAARLNALQEEANTSISRGAPGRRAVLHIGCVPARALQARGKIASSESSAKFDPPLSDSNGFRREVLEILP